MAGSKEAGILLLKSAYNSEALDKDFQVCPLVSQPPYLGPTVQEPDLQSPVDDVLYAHQRCNQNSEKQ